MTTRTDDVLERLGGVENRLTAVETTVELGFQNLREGQQQLRADLRETNNRIEGAQRETNSRIEGIQNRIEGLQRDFNARFDGIQTDFNARFDGIQTDFNARLDRLNARFDRLFYVALGGTIGIIVALVVLIIRIGSGSGS